MSADDELEALTNQARHDVPDAALIDSVDEALFGTGGPGGGEEPSGPGPASNPGWVGAGVVALAAGVGLVLWLAAGSSDPPSEPASEPVRVEPASGAPAPSSVSFEPEPAETTSSGATEETTLEPPEPSLSPDDPATITARRPRRGAGAEAPDELALLERARRDLAARPRVALRRLRQHQRAFPESLFAEERDAMHVQALAQLGLGEQARVRARAFRRRFPSSAHTRRVELALESLDGR